MTTKNRELLQHNAKVLADRCGRAIASGNETEAAKLAKCAATLMKLANTRKAARG